MRYDFDEYSATESPCKRCKRWANSFPDCMNGCRRLRAFQAALAGAVSTSKNATKIELPFLKVSHEKRD